MKLNHISSIQNNFIQGKLISKKLVKTSTLYTGDVNGKLQRCKRKGYMTVAVFMVNDKVMKAYIYGFIYEYHNLTLDNDYVFSFCRQKYVNCIFDKDKFVYSKPELSGGENNDTH